MSSSSFKNKRKNVIGISLVIILYEFLKVKPPKIIYVFNFDIPLIDPHYFTYTLWGLFFYLIYRYWTEWRISESIEYRKYMYNNIWNPLIKQVSEKVIKEYSDKKLYPGSHIYNKVNLYFTNDNIRFKTSCKIDKTYYNDTRGVETDGEIELFSSRFSKYVWKDYFPLRIKNLFNGKYLSESILPVFLISAVIVYVGIPSVVKWFINLINY